MEQTDWQDIWQDLEDVYDKIREKRGDGTKPEDSALDCILSTIEVAQSIAVVFRAVPVEPVE
jgi:hypothetical protein